MHKTCIIQLQQTNVKNQNQILFVIYIPIQFPKNSFLVSICISHYLPALSTFFSTFLLYIMFINLFIFSVYIIFSMNPRIPRYNDFLLYTAPNFLLYLSIKLHDYLQTLQYSYTTIYLHIMNVHFST